MSSPIPQPILDELTDVPLPREMTPPEISEHFKLDGLSIPVYRAPAVVLGSGAAGLRAAVELKRRGVEVIIVTRENYAQYASIDSILVQRREAGTLTINAFCNALRVTLAGSKTPDFTRSS